MWPTGLRALRDVRPALRHRAPPSVRLAAVSQATCPEQAPRPAGGEVDGTLRHDASHLTNAPASTIIRHVVANAAYKPKWRNWQTRYVQGVVGATPWEFKSPLRHHSMVGNSLMVERLTLDQVVGVRIPVPQPPSPPRHASLPRETPSHQTIMRCQGIRPTASGRA